MEDFSIRSIVEAVTRGQIRIPAFQRGFVWDPERGLPPEKWSSLK